MEQRVETGIPYPYPFYDGDTHILPFYKWVYYFVSIPYPFHRVWIWRMGKADLSSPPEAQAEADVALRGWATRAGGGGRGRFGAGPRGRRGDGVTGGGLLLRSV